MAKFFISQPMNGRTQAEIIAERERIKQFIEMQYAFKAPLEFIDSFNSDALGDGDPVVELGHCITLMHDADYVVFAPGWRESRGCKVEHTVAEVYPFRRIYVEDDKIWYEFSRGGHNV